MTAAPLRHRLARAADRAPASTSAGPPAQAPDWSEPTLDLLSRLSPAERAFAEWFASGLSAAASYRKATGRGPGPGPDTSRQEGYKLRSRPRVKAAIQACLSDRNVGARLDREALLAKLYALVIECEDSGDPRDKSTLVAALVAMARLQGFFPGRQPSPPPAAKTTVVSGLSPRIADLAAMAEAALVPPTKTPARGVGHAHQDGRTLGPLPAGREPPQPAAIPISAAAADQLASAAGHAPPRPWGYLQSVQQRFMGVG